jgi:hypothetical protein
MVVTMIAVGMVQVTLDEIIYMVAEVIRELDTLQQVEANFQGRRFLFRSQLARRSASRRESPPHSSEMWEKRFLFFIGVFLMGNCCFFYQEPEHPWRQRLEPSLTLQPSIGRNYFAEKR